MVFEVVVSGGDLEKEQVPTREVRWIEYSQRQDAYQSET